MSRDRHLRRLRTTHKRLSGTQIIIRLIVLVSAFGLLIIAGGLVLRTASQHGSSTSVGLNLNINPSLNPLEAAALSAILAMNQEALNASAGTDPSPVPFSIAPGEDASQVANRLYEMGLIHDAALFRNYLRYYGLDVQLEAGTFELDSTMTIPEIAQALTAAMPREVTIRITEGWRREQIADWLDQQGGLPFGGAEFLGASGAGSSIPPDLSVAGDIPQGISLEGFLFPDTYRLSVDSTAADLVAKMLQNFDSKVTAQLRADAAARGLTIYQVVTLASIVEREAMVAEERPLIASVYLNRLAVGMKLEADPTVQYAMGYQPDRGEWWNLDLTQEDYYAVDSPYNTYLYPGLPPGPIANPGIGSIQAVIYPAETGFLYFRAACDGSGLHSFALTYEEHLANECP